MRAKVQRVLFPELSGLILCGGRSSRLGQNKAFLPFKGKTLIEHALQLASPWFAELLLVSDEPELFEGLSSNLVKDIIPEKGPLTGIFSGLLVSSCPHTFVMPCNLPLLGLETVGKLVANKDRSAVVLYSRQGKVNPLLGVYAKEALPLLEDFVFKDVAAEVLEKKALFVSMPDTTKQQESEFSVNDPLSYAKLCGLIQ